MGELSMFHVFVLLLGIFLSSISQVMLKKAAMREYPTRLKSYLNPLVISAYLLFLGTSLMAIFAYQSVPLSMGAILESTGYLYVTFFGVTIFKEKITLRKLVGLALVVGDIAVYTLLG